MKNQVIRALSEVHGKQIIKYWKSRGIDTMDFTGANTGIYSFYGVINGIFENYNHSDVINTNTEIIMLPSDNSLLPKRMLVWNDDRCPIEMTVIHISQFNIKTPVMATIWSVEQVLNGIPSIVNLFTYCKEIERVKVEEMTMEQVCKELGREIKIIK